MASRRGASCWPRAPGRGRSRRGSRPGATCGSASASMRSGMPVTTVARTLLDLDAGCRCRRAPGPSQAQVSFNIMSTLLTIGEVARRSGVAASALRFYEERGLISPSGPARATAATRGRCCAGSRSSSSRSGSA